MWGVIVYRYPSQGLSEQGASRPAVHMSTAPTKPPTTGILPLFWDLAALDATKRHDAAATLIEQLGVAQAAHSDGGPCPDVTYTVRRLVRGLASSSPLPGRTPGSSLEGALGNLVQGSVFGIRFETQFCDQTASRTG